MLYLIQYASASMIYSTLKNSMKKKKMVIHPYLDKDKMHNHILHIFRLAAVAIRITVTFDLRLVFYSLIPPNAMDSPCFTQRGIKLDL